MAGSTALCRRAAAGDRGASLMLVLGFILIIGTIVASLTAYASTTLRSTEDLVANRSARYAVDAAMNAAIDWAADNPKVGTDPNAGVVNAEPCYFVSPAVGDQPEVAVTCEADPGKGSGVPAEIGQIPKTSILTLGQRNNEPPPYNGNGTCDQAVVDFFTVSTRYRERGIRLQKRKDPVVGCFNSGPYQNLQVTGDVVSNSPIDFEGSSNITTTGGVVAARGGCNFGCTTMPYTGLNPSGATALPVGSGMTAGIANDPRSAYWRNTNPVYAGSFSHATLPVGGAKNVPDNCPPPKAAGLPPFVVFSPGYYNSANELNQLFSSPSCKNAVFWFQPGAGPDGKILTDDDTRGVYYFEFNDTSAQFGTCESQANGVASNAEARRWCIGSANDFDQKVIGGTPYGWNPSVLYGTGAPPGTPAPGPSLDTAGEIGFFQFWSNPNGAKKIDDNSVARWNIPSGFDREIVLRSFQPQVPEGTFTGAQLDVKYKVEGGSDWLGDAIDAPILTVRRYGGLEGSATCKEVELPLQTSLTLRTIDVSDCITNAAEANNLEISFRATGCVVVCPASVELDGVRIRLNAVNGLPPLPGPPGTAPTGGPNPGGACDPTEPGVQFIMGGETHVWVADGTFELCAGAGGDAEQQIAIWGAPSIPPILPTDISSIQTSNASTVNAGDSRIQRIAEPELANNGDRRVAIQYGLTQAQKNDCTDNTPVISADWWLCSRLAEGKVRVSFPIWDPPQDYNADLNAGRLVPNGVRLRVSYDNAPNGFGGWLQDLINLTKNPRLTVVDLAGGAMSGCNEVSISRTADRLNQAGGNQFFQRIGYAEDVWDWVTIPDTCLSLPRLQNGFAVNLTFSGTTWCSFNSCPGVLAPGSFTDYLDGMEVLVDLKQGNTGSNPVVAPSSGCVRGVPNYFNGDPGKDCALVRASSNVVANIPILGPTGYQSQGRMSIKGTIYAPSAALDIDDFGLRYPLFSRGLIARTLMFRRVGISAAVPVAENTIDKTPARRVMTFRACTRTGPHPPSAGNFLCGSQAGDRVLATARVHFELDSPVNPSPTNLPRARIPKIIWWVSDRR